MVRYLMFMSYIGTRYRGAAKQVGCERLIDIDSIQGAIETALYSVKPHSLVKPIVDISSRTDAGVHALCNTAQVELEHPLEPFYDTDRLLRHLNLYFAKCGHEIRLARIYPISDEFHFRRSILSRTYIYRLLIAKNYDEHRVPISEMGRAWHIRSQHFDTDAIKSATKIFLGGKKNFESYAAKNRTNRTINYVRTLNSLTFEPTSPFMPLDPLSEGFDFWQFTVNSRAFVYNQVRRIVGALVAVGSGIISERDARLMLQIPSYKNWNERVAMAPPQGLYLKEINYDQEILKSHKIEHELISESKQSKLVSIN